ncbi:hypothetical protein [Cyclobacterium marinum]|uniref:Uncharacterized protein n=1 Tax=Cyclobacterium marinum (strain ATCC 25205 / DSM 745 / LMG 13164 / NCIMB 1802) TaxID=880070 RepID=G0J331_CYCMS|nr:hypothetical protein [Cyclobacterium marinum]AEL28327.1 hypothetical protein Cycma_4641 [Cyclobacterium marinum DSM 745]MBI0398183.1 hypothetical protein [Cyclobacterium marinum]|tara:strand:- start:17326 stop:17541 length:216 start_codon:yes stop_codon:yes gene_type:complete
MDLLIGALTIVAIVIAIFLLYNKIFKTKKLNGDAEQEISAKEVLGKEVTNIEKQQEGENVKRDLKSRQNDS